MRLEMISTGDEVLSGQIVDTNAAWFANTMQEHGIECSRRTTIGDNLNDLVDVFRERSHCADFVLVNGGLGPTNDDLSALAMSQAMGVELTENEQWRNHLEQWFLKRQRIMHASNLKQALLPKSAIMIDNPVGTACGFAVKFNRAWFFFTPGVPFEFKHMVTEQLLPFVDKHFSSDSIEVSKMLTIGQGESSLVQTLEHIALPEGMSLGFRCYSPYIEVKLIARGVAAIGELSLYCNLYQQALGVHFVSGSYSELASEVHQLLLNQGKTLTVTESCTGGMIANELIKLSGSSAYLDHGLVTYSNASKIKLLGVREAVLDQYGAVSIATVKAMSEGGRSILQSDFALATSGIAGPGGGSTTKPVGTVAIALSTSEGVYSQIIALGNRSREQIRKTATAVALDMLRRALNKQDVIVDYDSIKRVE